MSILFNKIDRLRYFVMFSEFCFYWNNSLMELNRFIFNGFFNDLSKIIQISLYCVHFCLPKNDGRKKINNQTN
jgi:hypothetical protein